MNKKPYIAPTLTVEVNIHAEKIFLAPGMNNGSADDSEQLTKERYGLDEDFSDDCENLVDDGTSLF